MKLYQHYKNKPYKFLGLARYSETGEEMVIYETRYESQGGKVWVRPKSMFFESIEVNGQKIPRFKEVPLKIIERAEITKEDIQAFVAPVMEKAFGQWDPKWFFKKFNEQPRHFLLVGVVEDQVVSFKLGYEKDARTFYSWLGGVIPEYRGLGIAADLMKHQHTWCKMKGYEKIQTKTQSRFREMFMLNLKNGFDVIGCHDSDEHGLKIAMEKKL